jgi:hypothetical protein
VDPATPEEASKPADEYDALAAPVAAWVDFEIRRALGVTPPGASASAESYALLQAGLERAQRGDNAAAQRFYEAALTADPWNHAALMNLANLEGRVEENYERAIDDATLAVIMIRVGPA